ncbi:serine/threonine-protein kinase pim-2-like [Neoarius graeffei]|uniref:serine/threonine-protein kinase pim-2-like n=1 Tax=Neoarius graeffei TaxID=443677 RepID=UPI00298D2AB6|nr:serine/threonine-protein kinase pim-2-like [Neoarius graeffei]
MDCNHPANTDPLFPNTCVAASCCLRKSKEKPLERKSMDVSQEELEPRTEERPGKRRRTETEEKGTQTIKTAKLPVYYTMGGPLGKGAFGDIFAGVRKLDGRKVAIKIEQKLDDAQLITLPGDTQRRPLEVALMELVCKPPHCPYVIEMVEWFETPSYFVLVLERPEPCVDLYWYCRCLHNSLSEHQVKIIMEKVIWAVLHCHERGVFHRDIKEENILINPQTLEVKLIDFGCGDLLKDTPYTEYSGTIIFSPPEYFTAHQYEAEPATVWGLGVLLYSLLCGEEPFNNYLEIIKGELNLPDELSEDSCSLITRCLEQDPERRANLEEVITHSWFNRPE